MWPFNGRRCASMTSDALFASKVVLRMSENLSDIWRAILERSGSPHSNAKELLKAHVNQLEQEFQLVRAGTLNLSMCNRNHLRNQSMSDSRLDSGTAFSICRKRPLVIPTAPVQKTCNAGMVCQLLQLWQTVSEQMQRTLDVPPVPSPSIS